MIFEILKENRKIQNIYDKKNLQPFLFIFGYLVLVPNL